MFALLQVLKLSGIKLLIFALEQKLKMHWNGLQKTFLLRYYTSKSKQAENSVLFRSFPPLKNFRHFYFFDLKIDHLYYVKILNFLGCIILQKCCILGAFFYENINIGNVETRILVS